MRNFFSHWKILLALVAAILLAIFTFRGEPARAAPPLAERLRLHALAIESEPGYAQAVLAAHGYRVRQQQYGSGEHSVSTTEAVLANIAPGARPERWFIVGSRYGAGRNASDDDGAGSGAAAVLELAGLLKHLRPAAGTAIRFVLFSAPPGASPGNFIAFVGTRAASGPVRAALAAFRDDDDVLVAGIAAPNYVQAVTLASHSSSSDQALLISDTAFARYPLFRAGQSEDEVADESEHENMARVVSGLARTLTALAAAPSG